MCYSSSIYKPWLAGQFRTTPYPTNMINPTGTIGNVLGDARAETDKLLSDSFVETPDFLALSTTNDFNFVVGRRGTGKSALFIRLQKFFRDNRLWVIKDAPKEYEALELHATIEKITDDYRQARAIVRIAWRVSALITILCEAEKHYKFCKSESYDYLNKFKTNHSSLLKSSTFKRCTQIIQTCIKPSESIALIPSVIASAFEVEHLQKNISAALVHIKKRIIFLFDNLDEGWQPRRTDSAVLGGLAATAAEFRDSQSPIHVLLFIRDNTFRALSVFDQDFSRHIEGNTLRLRWNKDGLFHLVALRLRKFFDIHDIENDTKIWNRFAKNDISYKTGFEKCLQHTLYRPRDILVLLNCTYSIASRSGRKEVIESDLDEASRQISQDRMQDLLKEYETVFPGLELLILHFKGHSAVLDYEKFTMELETIISESTFSDQKESDFAILSNAKQAFYALFSIGFVGMHDGATNNYIFCHDGSPATIDVTQHDQKVCIHPCHWKALNLEVSDLQDIPLDQIHDDLKTERNPAVQDFRMKLIGQLISELPKTPPGNEGAAQFEDWVFRAVRILFSGKLNNFELKPNSNSVQRRDIVATNNGDKGFWRRILEDYSTRQVTFEVKNYEKIGPDEARQATSYLSGPYGNFIIIVTRGKNEGLTESEKSWIKEMWDQHKKMIFTIPSDALGRCISKLRKSTERFDYTEDFLTKRLDIFVRHYLSLKIKR